MYETVKELYYLISPYINKTPIKRSTIYDRKGLGIYYKCENLQKTGSFKVRGALYRIMTLIQERDGVSSVVTASSGNHAIGLAYACSVLGLPAPTVFIPTTTSQTKRTKLEQLGAHVVIAGDYYDETVEVAMSVCSDKEYFVSTEDKDVLLGNATVALELLDQIPNVGTILVPCGGGILVTGIGSVVKSVVPEVRVIAVQTEASPVVQRSIQDGIVYRSWTPSPSLAEGLVGGCWPGVIEAIEKKIVDDVIIVSEEEIRDCIYQVCKHEGFQIEGSAAVGVSAALTRFKSLNDRPVVSILTGGNGDIGIFSKNDVGLEKMSVGS